MPVDDESVRDIIVGIFDLNRKLHGIAEDVRATRRELVEEDDDGQEEEEEEY